MDRRDEIEAIIPAVRATIRRMFRDLPSHVDIDDLVQEGLLRVLKYADRWQPGRGTFSGYALQHAVWGALDYIREQRAGSRTEPRLEPRSFDTLTEAEEPAADEVAAADEAWERKLWEMVDDGLTRVQASTLRRYCLDGVSWAEIARTDGVSDSAVAHRVTKAQAHLRPKLTFLL